MSKLFLCSTKRYGLKFATIGDDCMVKYKDKLFAGKIVGIHESGEAIAISLAVSFLNNSQLWTNQYFEGKNYDEMPNESWCWIPITKC